MKHVRSLAAIQLDHAWVTIGTFDGVHRGHQQIVSNLVKGAHAAGAPAVVVTFFPHPVEVLRGVKEALYLTYPEERAALLGALGVDVVVTLEFNQNLADLTAPEFMSRVRAATQLTHLWIGYDFRLGRGREGGREMLERLGQEMNFQVETLSPIHQDEDIVSSSLIRSLIRSGEAARAAELLGRPYQLEGEVIHGEARGRTMGFPTANVQVDAQRVLPLNGVYATLARFEGRCVPSVTNVGLRPTFNNVAQPRVEAHLFDFQEDLYGKHVALDFIRFIRPERRFNSIDELMAQMRQDSAQAREELAHAC